MAGIVSGSIVYVSVRIALGPAEVLPLRINEVVSGNANGLLDDENNRSDWIEIYNQNQFPVGLGGYSLSDDSGRTRWPFPSVEIPARGYAIVFADGTGLSTGALHANFRIDADGESISLFSPQREMIDEVQVPQLIDDISYGRQPDGWVALRFFDVPTPGGANISTAYDGVAGKPGPSIPSGFYPSPQRLTLMSTTQGASIFITTNGTTPTRQSTGYTNPMELGGTVMVRARTYAPNLIASPVETFTYILDREKTGTGVIALSYAQTPYQELPAHLDYFLPNGNHVISQDVGVEVHGHNIDHPSLALYARRRYGSGEILYQVFPDQPFTSYEGLLLRYGSETPIYFPLRDALARELTSNMDFDSQAYLLVRAYLVNGTINTSAYWLREKMNEHFLAAHYDLNLEDIDLLEWSNYELQVRHGDDAEYRTLLNYAATHDLSQEEYYNYVTSRIDLDSYLDYVITNVYLNRIDWLRHNIAIWRGRPDGKWRWVLFDSDWGFYKERAREWNTISILEQFDFWTDLSKNNEFRSRFMSAFEQHLATTFAPERVIFAVENLKTKIREESDANGFVRVSTSGIEDFARTRPGELRAIMNNYYAGNGPFTRGDSDGDSNFDGSDYLFTLRFLFLSDARPPCLDAADTNDDGGVNIADVVFAIRSLYDPRGVPLPPPINGYDGTEDLIDCFGR